MITVTRAIIVDRPPKDVWRLAGDLERSPEYFAGITKWEPKAEQRTGVGARYRVLMQIGSIQAGGTLRIIEWDDDRRLAWESEMGIEMTGHTEVEPHGAGTRLHMNVAFDLPGPAGWLVERITGRIVARNLWATLLAARRILEHDEDAA
ncbi:MAG: SRPBCC family protein [Actinomycetota bacterium]